MGARKKGMSFLFQINTKCNDNVHFFMYIVFYFILLYIFIYRLSHDVEIPRRDVNFRNASKQQKPPSSIQANIISFCSHILPSQDVIEELTCVKHIRNMRTVQLTVAKMLADKTIGEAKQTNQLHSTDETSKLQTQVTNALLSILQEDDTLKTV